ncbi:SRPBCC domain-containing protein [Chitinophaga horti]|uniref:SRPBCC domain-containing protein n=1 Tax=Chitinophaga horti TaxID=2920382 RepID=A0ABY6J8N0_9BACT|nr:SRPBCC domain-containing protein [Chitinophaga horti]UYQ94667.1 SRPBCC domain-containing protein [Chitinophaga horti]
MEKLFVDQSIDINAPASIVWEVLTHPDFNIQWIHEWWPEIKEVKTEWKTAGPVQWMTGEEEIGAEGRVFIANPPLLLSYSFSVIGKEPAMQEDIIYKLEEIECGTRLSVSVGDFSDSEEHIACFPGAVVAWSKSLPKIKQLSEQQIVHL